MTSDVIDEVLISHRLRNIPYALQGTVLASVDRTWKLVLKSMHEDLAPENLSWAGWWLLMLLDYSKHGALPATRIARRAGADASTVTRTIDRLVRNGYVRRRRSPEDGRVVIIELTEEGRAAHHRAFERQAAKAFGFSALDDEECETLLALLKKVRESHNDTSK